MGLSCKTYLECTSQRKFSAVDDDDDDDVDLLSGVDETTNSRTADNQLERERERERSNSCSSGCAGCTESIVITDQLVSERGRYDDDRRREAGRETDGSAE